MKAILTYHSIDESGSAISVSPRAFDAHLRWFASGRARVRPLDELVSNPVDGGDEVAIVFDDAFANAREPVQRLLEAGLPATLFVVSGQVGGTNAWGGQSHPGIPTLPLLDWAALESLVARDASVEAHTRTHRPLTRLSHAELEDELLGCREDLRAHLGVTSGHVAYPYGAADARVAARVGMYFRWGHTTEFRALDPTVDPLWLPRLDMYYFQGEGDVERWGTAAFRRRIAWCRARRMIRARLLGGWTPAPVRR